MDIKVKKISTLFFLQLSLGIFFFILGLYGILPGTQESVFSLSDNVRSLEIIFGLLELVCSVILLGGLVLSTRKKMLYSASFVVFCFWAARILISKIILGINPGRRGIYFSPDFATWILILSIEFVVLVSIFIICKTYSR